MGLALKGLNLHRPWNSGLEFSISVVKDIVLNFLTTMRPFQFFSKLFVICSSVQNHFSGNNYLYNPELVPSSQ